MKTADFSPTIPSPQRAVKPCVIRGFQSIPPRFKTAQSELLNWLIEAHVRSGNAEKTRIEELFQRCSASAEHIAARGHELEDFSHQRWQAMHLFGPKGSDLELKTRFFSDRVNNAFEMFYPNGTSAPAALIHVTCTGYAAPSGAQQLVSRRDWGRQTEVLHAYHMGCYAAHPGVRMAQGLVAASLKPLSSVDVVHTELCSLHFDPTAHEPAQVVIQSLFADGFIKYQVQSLEAAEQRGTAGLEVVAAYEEIIPDSADVMTWSTGPLHFTMGLSKEVPTLFASALPQFVKTLLAQAQLKWEEEKPRAVFAIHPGGPRIIELSQRILNLAPSQVALSREVLRQHGNMSSATLPHIWQQIVLDQGIPTGTLVVSLGAGPGLTLSGLLFRKRG